MIEVFKLLKLFRRVFELVEYKVTRHLVIVLEDVDIVAVSSKMIVRMMLFNANRSKLRFV